jgi:membrane fusion protein, multidrug efflux system
MPDRHIDTPETEPATENQYAPPPKPRRHLWVWVVILAAFVLLGWWILRGGGNQSASSQAGSAGARRGLGGPVPVTTATAGTGNLGVYYNAIGTVTPVYTVSVTAQVSGVINSVHYREGQNIGKGDSLIDIDPRPYEAQLEQAQGALERDQNLLAQAQMDYERYKTAWSKNAIPRQTYEDQEKVVQQLQGTVKNDEGTVRYDQVQVAFCHITSPIAGRVGLRLVDPGNLVTANGTTALVVITQMQPMTIIFTLSEDNLADVLSETRKGKKLTVEAWDRQMTHKIASGDLATIDNQIDTTTGTLRLRANFNNRQDELFPNQFVNTRLLVRTLENQTIAPASAIQHNGDQAFVYVVSNGQVKMTPVKTGITDNGMTAVEGIQAGEVLADSSFDKLQDGAKVTVANQPQQGSGSGQHQHAGGTGQPQQSAPNQNQQGGTGKQQ